MDSATDIPIMEAKIDYLLKRYIASDELDTIASPCNLVLDSVFQQARISSQGGKRLRALLTLATFDAASHANAKFKQLAERRKNVIDLACAIEVFQTGALVHDDIIDDSDLRRGKPSAHVALSRTLSSSDTLSTISAPPLQSAMLDQKAKTAFGKGLGIMLGDILATASISIAHRACESLSELYSAFINQDTESQLPSEDEHTERNHTASDHHVCSTTTYNTAVGQSANDMLNAFLSMHREVEIGQVLDLGVEHVPLDNPDQLITASLSVFRWKTASYTTIAPIELGLLAAGFEATTARSNALAIGTKLGLAFQLADDLLDVIGDSTHTGKPVGGDIREGKRTVLLADALAGAHGADRQFLSSVYEDSHRTDEEVTHTIDLFHSTGAIERSQQRIAELWQESSAALTSSSISLGLDSQAEDLLRNTCAQFIPEELREL
ncbi:MAG: polyprenyl synthetase family protein [Bifidobacterium sp.]|jgi:geranylgeranyl diphosphate synthase type I|nr:polyprenyl synthetase family protein [Bifidobacterium sp.]MCH4174604.1 polyprenyl synthetase family protein [Bifidobacterium sp.]